MPANCHGRHAAREPGAGRNARSYSCCTDQTKIVAIFFPFFSIFVEFARPTSHRPSASEFCDLQELVKGECERWAAEGINVKYETRKDRAGYKAGNLKEGMRHAYVRACEFVAMFDADFQPAPDFLVKTVPFLVHNPSLALVQTRWKFGESYLSGANCQPTTMAIVFPSFFFFW